jgi:osmotically-inducible protein OsmY
MSPTAPVISPAAEALKRSAHPALRQLDVQETDSTIVLTGCVSSYYLKQLAQEAVMPVRGVRQLLNQVTVIRA